MLGGQLLLLTLAHQNGPILITHSGSFAPPESVIASADVDHPAILIKGDHLVVDFGNRTVRGTPADTEPDDRRGVAIQVQGNDVTVRHAKVHGYKVALLARNCEGLKVHDCDFSYNWKQHLKSTPEREDESDWMSYHQNDKDEWLYGRPSDGVAAYAGAMYLRGCDNFEVKNVRVTGGENGLMMSECNHGLAWNNDFSYLSGIGIGMYRSSDNRIMHNKVDWCVRGYSHGVYNRGQDSAGLLVYEQSDRNVFAYNSVTHGGDGFFLWAGQSTMDTGKGGCNDNLVYGNDFSHAPTNGIEATFSRNAFLNNKVLECWHGVWGGYSYDTKIQGNAFGLNGEAISIEHGQNNTISSNTFYRDNDGIGLWQNKTQDPNWGYPKNRDTRSRDYTISDNYFSDIPGSVFHIRATRNVTIKGNRINRFRNLLKEEEPNPNLIVSDNRMNTSESANQWWREHNTVSVNAADAPLPSTIQSSGEPVLNDNEDAAAYVKRFDVTWDPYPLGEERRKATEAFAPAPLKGAKDPFLKPTDLRGRRYIIVDEWGPYDFRRPLLHPRTLEPTSVADPKAPATPQRIQKFDVFGPAGRWRVSSISGATADVSTGDIPGELTLHPTANTYAVALEYTGGQTIDYRGNVLPRGKSVSFGYSHSAIQVTWKTSFYRWSRSENAADAHAAPADFSEVLKSNPIASQIGLTSLDFHGGSFGPGIPSDHFATLADGTFNCEAGDYELDLTTDDGARVWVDGKLVIADAWKYQGPTLYQAELSLAAGEHKIRVEHFQIDGYAQLSVRIKKKR